jgi:hypothetical protein
VDEFQVFSACSLRPQRLCGDNAFDPGHRRDAENAEVAQRISNWATTQERSCAGGEELFRLS